MARGRIQVLAAFLVAVGLLAASAGAAATPGDLSRFTGRAVPALGDDIWLSGPDTSAFPWPAVVAFNATDNEYLVVWVDRRSDGTRELDIYGRRVAADGSPLGADIRICGLGATTRDEGPAVVWNATDNEYLVVWQDRRNFDPRGIDIYGRLVGADGVPIGSDLRISGLLSQNEMSPALAWNATENEYLVVWADTRNWLTRGNDIYGRRVGSDGARLGPDFRITGNGGTGEEGRPAVVWNGTGYLVAWEDGRREATRGTDIYGRLVGADGSRPDPDFRINGKGAIADDYEPAVAWNGTEYLVVWMDGRDYDSRDDDIYGRRLGADGSRLGADLRVSGPGATGDDFWPAVAWNDDDAYLVTWSDERNPASQADARGRFVAADGSRPEGDFRINGSGVPADQYSGALVWNGSAGEFLAVWVDSRDGADWQVYGRRLAG